MAFLQKLKPHVLRWAKDYGLTEDEAARFANDIPDYYVRALFLEWGDNQSAYSRLAQAYSGPFFEHAQRQMAFAKHHEQVQAKLDEPLFGDDGVSLRDVYIPLRATYMDTNSKGYPVHYMVDAGARLLAWLAASEPPPETNPYLGRRKTKAVSGGPGAGKSTLAYHFAELAIRRGWRVLFVPMQRFTLSRTVREGLDTYLRDYLDIEGEDLFARDAGRTLLIFDGLDELSLASHQTQESITRFIHDVIREVDTAPNEDLLALLLGRTQVVKPEQARALGATGQVLELEPYRLFPRILPGTVSEPQFPRGPNGSEPVDQRSEWWRRYTNNKGLDFADVEKRILDLPDKHDLTKLTAEPLLNYLIAKLYESDPENFPTGLDINDLYRRLIEHIYRRPWGDGTSSIAAKISSEDFLTLLEHVGMCAWQGGTLRIARVKDIVEKGDKGIETRLSKLNRSLEEGALRLLTAFYTAPNQPTPDADRTFEFTHKSFGEYLTARYLVSTWARTCELYKQGDLSEYEFLTRWARVCGSASISPDLGVFVRREISGRKEAADWQGTAIRLFKAVVRKGLPMGAEDKSGEAERNTLASLLLLHSACARVSGETFGVFTFDGLSVAQVLNKLNTVPHSQSGHQAWRNHLDVHGEDLTGVDLRKADFSHSNLNSCKFEGTVFDAVVWEKALFSDTNLEGCAFFSADLYGCAFFASNLSRCYINGGRMVKTKFGGEFASASMVHCCLEATRFDECDFTGVYLSRATASSVTFQACIFDGADFTGVVAFNTHWLANSFEETSFLGGQLSRVSFAEPDDLTAAQLVEVSVLNEVDIEQAGFGLAEITALNPQIVRDPNWELELVWKQPRRPPGR